MNSSLRLFFSTALLMLCFTTYAFGQNEDDIIEWHIFQPNAFVYEDLGEDKEGEIDLYRDGAAQFSLQLLGVDLLTKGKTRFGLGIGGGMSKPSSDDANTDAVLVVFNSGFVLQYREAIRLEIGVIWGYSLKEAPNRSQRDDSAIYLGLAFPTKIKELLTGK